MAGYLTAISLAEQIGEKQVVSLLKASLAEEQGAEDKLIGRTTGYAVVLGLIALVSTACNNGSETDMSYKAAINDHFKAFPICIWPQPKKFPVQAATSDGAKTEGYDALTQEGLLTRTTAEKKVLIVASKQVNNYDLSEKGRTSWTPDSTHRDMATSATETARSHQSTIRHWARIAPVSRLSLSPTTIKSPMWPPGPIRRR